MLGLLKYSDDFSKAQGLNQLWKKDATTTAVLAENTDFNTRQSYHIISNYDSYLFIKKMFIKNSEERLECIATNEEKYISFSKEIVLFHITDKNGEKISVKREIRFIDSFRFMSTSLDALIKNLDQEQCKNLKKFYSDPMKFDLLKRKGVYPYDYVDSVDKLVETALPPKEAFYSKLNNEETPMKTTNTLKQFRKNLE